MNNPTTTQRGGKVSPEAPDSTTNGAAVIDAVPGVCAHGLPVLPCDGKRPIHDGWQHRNYTADEVVAELRRVAAPMIGGTVRYRRDEILRWIAAGCPASEAEAAL